MQSTKGLWFLILCAVLPSHFFLSFSEKEEKLLNPSLEMMNDEEAKRCPLCAEEMDWTDQQLKPCKCSYQVCVWCWHQIMDMAEKDGTEGRCPACWSPYDKDKIVGMESNFERVVANANRKHKPAKAKPKTSEGKKDLSNVRAIQRKMAYVIGLPLSLADEDLLKQKDFFGQYGKVCKISLSRTAGGEIQQFVNDSCSVYITFSKEEEAVRCIQSVHEFVLEGRFLRASFGTAKYCHAWLRNVPCNNPACLYLHSLGAEEDSFGKDEVAAVITRSRVQQIVGTTHNLHRRAGNVLPPPEDGPFSYNSASVEKPIESDQKDVPRDMETLSGQLTCSHSSKDKDALVKAPKKGTTFVDIVGNLSSSSPENNGNVAEAMRVANLCSEISSMDIHKDNNVEVLLPDAMLYSNGFPSNDDFKEPYRQHSKENSGSQLDSRNLTSHVPYITVNGDRLKDSGSLSLEGPIVPSSYPLKTSEYSTNHVHEASCNLSDYFGLNIVHNRDKASLTCTNFKTDGYNENKFQSSAKSDVVYRSSKSFSKEEIVEHLRRLDDDERIYDAQNPNLDAVEKSIISNIMSLGLDAADDLSTSRSSVAGLFNHTNRQHGSLWNLYNNDRSMFSFGNREGFANQPSCLESSFSDRGQDFRLSSPQDSGEKERYSCKPQYLVASNAEVPFPPGFSLPARDPPPGFCAYERADEIFHANSGSGMVKSNSFSRNHYRTLSKGNSSNISDIDLMDPAIMSVGNGNPSNQSSYSYFDARSHSSSQPSALDDEARSWLLNLLMQQSTPAHQDMQHAQSYMQQALPSRQDPIYSGQIGNGHSSSNDMYGPSLKYTGQLQQSNNTSLSQQKLENGLFSNGYQPCIDGMQLRNELGSAELHSNGRLGFNKLYSGYGEYILQPGFR